MFALVIASIISIMFAQQSDNPKNTGTDKRADITKMNVDMYKTKSDQFLGNLFFSVGSNAKTPNGRYDGSTPIIDFDLSHYYNVLHRNSLVPNFGGNHTFHLASTTSGITYKFPKRGFKYTRSINALTAPATFKMDAINAVLAQVAAQEPCKCSDR